MRPSASTLQRLAGSLHERWEGLGPQAMDAVRHREDIPAEAVSASVSRRDGGAARRRGATKPAGAKPPAARSASSTPKANG